MQCYTAQRELSGNPKPNPPKQRPGLENVTVKRLHICLWIGHSPPFSFLINDNYFNEGWIGERRVPFIHCSSSEALIIALQLHNYYEVVMTANPEEEWQKGSLHSNILLLCSILNIFDLTSTDRGKYICRIIWIYQVFHEMQMPLEVKEFWLGDVEHCKVAAYATFFRLDSQSTLQTTFLLEILKNWQAALQAQHTVKSLTL